MFDRESRGGRLSFELLSNPTTEQTSIHRNKTNTATEQASLHSNKTNPTTEQTSIVGFTVLVLLAQYPGGGSILQSISRTKRLLVVISPDL